MCIRDRAYTTILGLPGETEEDEIMTTQLILTMERELEEKLGNRAHFTVTPLAFIPMGLLKDKEFFNVEEMMTEGRFLHLYHAWKHLYKEVIRGLPMVMRGNLFLLPFYPLARLGARLVVEHIRKWGIRRGFNPDKRLEPLDVRIDVDEHRWYPVPSLIEAY